MTDADGKKYGETVKYLPFGEARTAIDIPTDKLFTGQRLDGTGLYYYNARYYDPMIGRFISPDTVITGPANPQCYNRYSYCLNNPLKYTDPSGHVVVIDGVDITDIDKAVRSGDYDAMLQMASKINQDMDLVIAYGTLRGAAPELTSYLEKASEIISIEYNNVVSPLAAAQWHAGIGGNSWIYINQNQKGMNTKELAAQIGHEGFHGAISVGAGHHGKNFAANEAFAYSFTHALYQKLGIGSNWLCSQMSDIKPGFSGDLDSRISIAATTLFGADSYNYGRENFGDWFLNLFSGGHRHPLKNWANNDKKGSKFLTVAQTVWIK